MDETPSSILNRAADLIRDTARSAFPGPWTSGDRCVWADDSALDAVVDDGSDGDGGVLNEETAQWIALLNPAMAVHIEAWLRVSAEDAHITLEDGRRLGHVEVALEFARSVLGEADA